MLGLLFSVLAYGEALSKYKQWDSSPESFFMTRAERAEWATIRTDADAEQFVQKYLARRPASFSKEVAERAAAADKHLSFGGQAGSRTLRGKVVVLLGPPAGFTISPRQIKSAGGAGASSSVGASMSAAGDGGRSGVMSVEDMSNASNRKMAGSRSVNDYIFTYAGGKLPVKSDKDLVISVEVDEKGSDKIRDRKALSELESQFEAVAAASMAPAQNQ
jgi:hypothetical protein